MDRYLSERGSDPVGLVGGVAAVGRAPLVGFEGDIDNVAITPTSLGIVVVGGNISYITFPTLIGVARLAELDLRIEDGLQVGVLEGCMGMGSRAVNEI